MKKKKIMYESIGILSLLFFAYGMYYIFHTPTPTPSIDVTQNVKEQLQAFQQHQRLQQQRMVYLQKQVNYWKEQNQQLTAKKQVAQQQWQHIKQKTLAIPTLKKDTVFVSFDTLCKPLENYCTALESENTNQIQELQCYEQLVIEKENTIQQVQAQNHELTTQIESSLQRESTLTKENKKLQRQHRWQRVKNKTTIGMIAILGSIYVAKQVIP